MPPVASEPKFAAHAPLLPNPAARAGNGASPGLEPFAALLDDAPSASERPPARADNPRPRRESGADDAKTSPRASDTAPARPKEHKPAKSKDDGGADEKAAADKSDAGKADADKSAAETDASEQADAAGNAKHSGEGEFADALDATGQAPTDADVAADVDDAPAENQKPAEFAAPEVVIAPDVAPIDEAAAPNAAPANPSSEIAKTATAATEAADVAPLQAAAAKANTPQAKAETPTAAPKNAAAKPVAALKSDGEAQQSDADPLEAELADGKQADAAQDKDADLPAKAKTKPDAPTHQHARRETPASTMVVETSAAAKTGAEHAQPILNTQNVNHAAANAAAQIAPPAATQAATVPVSGIAVEIAARAFSGKNRFEIRLDPPELGRIDVRLDVDRQGHVTSRLVVERADTLDMLRRDAASLERALQDAGLKTSDNGLQFALRDHAGGEDGQQNTGSDRAQLVVHDDELPAIEATQHGYRRIDANGGIDIRV